MSRRLTPPVHHNRLQSSETWRSCSLPTDVPVVDVRVDRKCSDPAAAAIPFPVGRWRHDRRRRFFRLFEFWKSLSAFSGQVAARHRRCIVGHGRTRIAAADRAVVARPVAGGPRRPRRPIVRFHVLAERRRVRVRFVAAGGTTDVRLVGGVDVRMLLTIGTVGKAASAADELASKRSLA